MKRTLTRKWWMSLGVTMGLVALLVATGAAVAQPPLMSAPVSATRLTLDPGGGPSETMAFTYQGRLVNGGVPANGNYDFIINLYDNPTVGSPVAACSNIGTGSLTNQPVANGVFTFYLYCGSNNSSVFSGGERWIEVQVRPTGTTTYTMLPRQPISPTPYAFSLYPGAVISSTAWGYDFGDALVNIRNNNVLYSALQVQAASGSAVRAESANGNPIIGVTETGYGVFGYDGGTAQSRGYAGYFDSTNGVGVYGHSNAQRTAGNQYAPGVYGRSAEGVGVYGVSNSSAGWMAGVLGENPGAGYGVSGLSQSGSGVRGWSSSSYGGEFSSWDGTALNVASTNDVGANISSPNYRAIYASSGMPGLYTVYVNNTTGSTGSGLYVNGTIVATGSKSGYVVDLVRNAGAETLTTGDVVVIVGYDTPAIGEIPLVLVRKATEAESTAVGGVIDQAMTVPSRTEAHGENMPHPLVSDTEAAPSIPPGGYANMVTLGSYKAIHVDASGGPIHPGDLLVASSRPGYAMRSVNPRVGAVLGKALDTLESGTGTIPVMISLK